MLLRRTTLPAFLAAMAGLAVGSPASAECFNCNYGLAIFLLGTAVLAGITALVGLFWLIIERRVPKPLIVIFVLLALPLSVVWTVGQLDLR